LFNATNVIRVYNFLAPLNYSFGNRNLSRSASSRGVVESTGKCKLETHRFGTSDCRKVRRSERVHERVSFCVLRNAIRNAREERGVSAANGNRIRALHARCIRTIRNWTTTTRQRIGAEA